MMGAILLVVGGLIAPGVFETTAIRAQSQVAGTAKDIRAKRFILEDEKGGVRALLWTSKDGPELTLCGENGKVGARLAVPKEGPILALYDENDAPRARLCVGKNGPGLLLDDENGKNRIGLNTGKSSPSLSLWDENGKNRAALWASKASPSLSLWDENGKPPFTAGKAKTESPDGKIIEYPESSLILYGPDGKVIWSAIK